MKFLRALTFNTIFWIMTFSFSALIVIFRPFGVKAVYPLAVTWSASSLILTKLLCGITYEIKFMGDLPKGPAVYLSNHQSAWETVAYPALLPPFMWVLKKELKHVPLFGWCIMALGHIGIDRDAGTKAIRQINKEGKKILDRGFNMAIFPEGTRTLPGQLGPFNPGGVGLAITNQVPIVPIAQNAGRLWGKDSFYKTPGHITVIVEEAISTEGVAPSERKALNEKVRNIIAKRLEEIDA